MHGGTLPIIVLYHTILHFIHTHLFFILSAPCCIVSDNVLDKDRYCFPLLDPLENVKDNIFNAVMHKHLQFAGLSRLPIRAHVAKKISRLG